MRDLVDTERAESGGPCRTRTYNQWIKSPMVFPWNINVIADICLPNEPKYIVVSRRFDAVR
jgi:hypothetical protein